MAMREGEVMRIMLSTMEKEDWVASMRGRTRGEEGSGVATGLIPIE